MSRGQADSAIDVWNLLPPIERLTAFERRAADAPNCAENWFLLAIAQLSTGDVRRAAQYFGKAYHADPSLESAALMTFACLKAAANLRNASLPQLMTITWNEMRKPPLGRLPRERRLLEAWAASLGAVPPEMPCTADDLARLISGRGT